MLERLLGRTRRPFSRFRVEQVEVKDARLIVGLGNPGPKYARNRHNIGFQCVQVLADRHGLSFDTNKAKARIAIGNLSIPDPSEHAAAQTISQKAGLGLDAPPDPLSTQAIRSHGVILAKPQTFMNVAGQSVSALARFYKVPPAAILVLYDDLDLPLGKLRLRPSGGAGGHNGVKSIIEHLGTDAFSRLRIGIDRPPGRMEPADYVLQDFSASQEEIMVEARERAADACEHWLVSGIESAMNAFN